MMCIDQSISDRTNIVWVPANLTETGLPDRKLTIW